MIGLISSDAERSFATEFFELFKIPWELYVAGRNYACVISTTGHVPEDPCVELVVVYHSEELPLDRGLGLSTRAQGPGAWIERDGTRFPIYGSSIGFGPAEPYSGRFTRTGDLVQYERSRGQFRIVRVGYQLLEEIRFLISHGQPRENAAIPTLELHISLLRDILVRAGVPFTEVLAAPAGYDFMVCLTHDVDFAGIREHKFDSTMLGFLYRATFGSLKNALTGYTSWSKCWTNWRAALSLPLVHLGIMPDFWLEFDRYRDIEKDLGSTFFFIPFRNYPGIQNGLRGKSAPARRAAKYDVLKLKQDICQLQNDGIEIGLHGIDAWHDLESARQENFLISNLTGQDKIGVRMHWLYFGPNSPQVLESAQLSYDSTFGYNDAIGFRAGTAQVFRLPSSSILLELPLIIQDTALFYPDRMNLSEEHAMNHCGRIIEHLSNLGGVLTVNWHTRSLSPERLWGDFYRTFISRLRNSRVWFGTACQLVNWFKSRRAITFDVLSTDTLRVTLKGADTNEHAPFNIRVYNDCSSCDQSGTGDRYHDVPWEGGAMLAITLNRAARA